GPFRPALRVSLILERVLNLTSYPFVGCSNHSSVRSQFTFYHKLLDSNTSRTAVTHAAGLTNGRWRFLINVDPTGIPFQPDVFANPRSRFGTNKRRFPTD